MLLAWLVVAALLYRLSAPNQTLQQQQGRPVVRWGPVARWHGSMAARQHDTTAPRHHHRTTTPKYPPRKHQNTTPDEHARRAHHHTPTRQHADMPTRQAASTTETTSCLTLARPWVWVGWGWSWGWNWIWTWRTKPLLAPPLRSSALTPTHPSSVCP